MRDFLSEWRWAPHVLAIELKKAFSYRVTFWSMFLLSTGTDLALAYFLWRAIFEARGLAEMEGFSLHGIVLYYLFASFAGKITRGQERGYVSQEIYDGSLTRYLLYPLPFFAYKYVTHLTYQLLAIFQLLVGMGFFWLVIGIPADQKISPGSFAAGALTCLLTGYVHFMMMSCLEMVAFWQDVVWNLMLMLRFAMGLLGGALVPLVFFPEWGRYVANLTPFPAMVSFPARTFLGQVSLGEWLFTAGTLVGWGLLFSLITSMIWARGTKQYSGVGV